MISFRSSRSARNISRKCGKVILPPVFARLSLASIVLSLRAATHDKHASLLRCMDCLSLLLPLVVEGPCMHMCNRQLPACIDSGTRGLCWTLTCMRLGAVQAS